MYPKPHSLTLCLEIMLLMMRRSSPLVNFFGVLDDGPGESLLEDLLELLDDDMRLLLVEAFFGVI